MFCPSCFLPDAYPRHSCSECRSLMCDDCATFALHCGTVVCLNCDTHSCTEEVCDRKLLVNLKVKDLLEVFCGEKVSRENWERMGEEYDPTAIRDLSVDRPFTNLYSFPQILEVKVYGVTDYSSVAHQIWRRILIANSPACTFDEYTSRLTKMSDYEFVCWYQYRLLSPYSTFEDRVFIKSPVFLKPLQNAYYGDSLKGLVEKVKGRLMLKNERFSTAEDRNLPK